MPTTEGTTDKAEQLLELLHNSQNPEHSEVELVSGTAKQDTTGKNTTYYIPITGGTAGTVKVEVGPTSATAIEVIAPTAANAVASQTLTIKLPAKWFVKVTVSVATIPAKAQVVTG
jgi:hypothetical protein